MAVPISAATPGERKKATARRGSPPLISGRPVTDATVRLRDKYWAFFSNWMAASGYDLPFMVANHLSCVEEINLVLAKFGRELHRAGKSYNQYAETINAFSSRCPALRRMLQQAWGLGYAWAKSEPSNHHVAMPASVLLAMITTAIYWGWVSVAGMLALGFGGLLRPGELCTSFRRDLLLPSDVGQTVDYALLSIREPKSRFTHARHQSAKIDAADLVQVLELAFRDLHDGQRLWAYSPQTLRTRFKSLLEALKLPSTNTVELRCLDLGSLRSGGATYIIQTLENAELCRRRGRWASMRMMDIYVQEVMALQYLRTIRPQSKELVLKIASFFSDTFLRAQKLHDEHVPETLWFRLLSWWKKPWVEKDGWRNWEKILYNGKYWQGAFWSCTTPTAPGFKSLICSLSTMLGRPAMWIVHKHLMEKACWKGERIYIYIYIPNYSTSTMDERSI